MKAQSFFYVCANLILWYDNSVFHKIRRKFYDKWDILFGKKDKDESYVYYSRFRKSGKAIREYTT